MQILIVNALSKGHIRGYRTPVDQTPLTPELREVIIGVLLGEAYATAMRKNAVPIAMLVCSFTGWEQYRVWSPFVYSV
jgi:hypothetical protein